MPKIIDRKNEALSIGEKAMRSINQIDTIGIHYTATTNSNIENHERYWKSKGWKKGGYLFWIARNGDIYQNYNYTRITNGATGWNTRTAHFSMEASTKFNYTDAQIESMYWLINKMLKDLPNTSIDRVKGHKELTNNTQCPGWNKNELDEIRYNLKHGLVGNPAKAKAAVAKPVSKPVASASKSIDQLVAETNIGKHGNGEERKRSLGSNYDAVMAIINGKQTVKPKPAAKSLSQLVEETKIGDHGNGDNRKKSLGSNYDAVMAIINGTSNVKPKAVSKKYNLPKATYWAKNPQFSGTGVRAVQEALGSIYFYPDKGAKNNGIDGYYGNKTAEVVKRFQGMYGLKQDGKYGEATRKKLDSLVN